MKSVKFSVMVPVYNVEPFLEKCLRSVLEQTYKNYELILVDDGSTDNSGAICDKYALDYPFIRVFHKSNGGLMSSRQFALKKASGDYYIFLDSDDWLEKNALEIIDSYLDQHDVDCVVFGYKRVTDAKVISETPNEGTFELADKSDLYFKCFCDSRYNPLCRKSVKASLFEGKDYSNYYYLSHAEDLLQSIEVYKNCRKILFVDDKLYNYRLNPGSITNQSVSADYKPDFTIRKLVWDFLVEEKVFSNERFDKYREYSVKLFFDELYRIASSNLRVNQKKAIFNQIRDDVYFQKYLITGVDSTKRIKNGKRLRMFLKGKYRSLLVKGAFLSICKRIKHVIRRK